MPTYEYECRKCQHHHEAFQSITAKPLTKCPKCSGRLKRMLGTGSGFIFKGGGFYITDYRSKNYQEGKKKDESASAGSKPKDKSCPSTGDSCKNSCTPAD
jgi:putative FmdB family regulatory protein